MLVYSCSQYFLIIFSYKVSCNVPFSFLILVIFFLSFPYSLELNVGQFSDISKNQFLVLLISSIGFSVTLILVNFPNDFLL